MVIKFFGQYLIRQKIVTIPQLVAALEYQESHNRLLGTYGVDTGQISDEDIETVLDLQHRKDILFGEGALELGLLSESQLRGLILAQQEDHVQLGNALTDLGYVDKETMKRALDVFTKEHGTDVELESEIPQDIRDRSIVSRFFDVTQKMLLRKWGVRNKPIEIRTTTQSLLLSDYNVEVAIDGHWTGRYLLAAPIEVTSRAALRILGTERITDDDRDELIIEFANAVCGNLLDLFSEEAKEIKIEAPVCIPQKYHLSDGKAVVLSFLTNDGLVFTGVVL
jgi:CheY-specific phosphatase CheX